GDVQGLRVDHVDGLRDPRGYLQTLRGRAAHSWLLVEKILEPGERLPADWPVDGTTGYEFIDRLQGLFVERGSEEILTSFYAEFTAEPVDYAEVVQSAKLEAARDLFQPDVLRLERLLEAVCQGSGVDVSRDDRVEVIRHVAAGLDAYRTYSTDGSAVTAESRARINAASAAAAKAAPAIPAQLLALVREALLMERDGAAAIEFAIRFQQLSGPLMAKGVEDTAFYRYNRLVCLNEVGGNPARFGVTPEEFHAANLETLQRHPQAMLASSTHDTKRSEDVRARLSLLTQVAEQWTAAVRRWAAMNEPHRRTGVPDRNGEYLLYQTLVGAWPLTEDRVQAFMEKAAREARRYTSWTDPDSKYETGLRAFVGAVMDNRMFQRDLEAFVQPLIEPGRAVSLAQVLLKLTAPGIPDFYQGTELWDLSLVDPDNRRPVDFGLRSELMSQHSSTLQYGGVHEDLVRAGWDDGLPKLQVIARSLTLRRSSAAAFGRQSTYTPLYAEGQASGHLIAYG
ncbi:MAG TPA: malto-oligosyltrehalose synthase, partial [Candidatus Dormibacteraeota bacterium]|nr:malto-oligosyltrehalose synthase [Candidatus Dormibacteraeota bacterium]